LSVIVFWQVKGSDTNMKNIQPIPLKAIDQLLEHLRSSGKEQVHDICFFMLNCGLRIAEITEIKFSDVDFSTGVLLVDSLKSGTSGSQKLKIKLNDNCLTLLTKLRDQYPDDIWVFQSRQSNNQINKQPRSVSRQAVNNVIKQANQHTEHKLSLHSFRHAYATYFLRDQLSSDCILDLKSALMHNNIDNTYSYIKK
jgi:integrase